MPRLLDILASRKSTSSVSGVVLFDGNKPSNVKCNTGYVVQVSVMTFI